MDEMIQRKLMQVLNVLIPGNKIKIRSATDLTYNPDPAVQELCEAAELIHRLSKEERT